MKKGLHVTLFTVAIAVMALQAMAMAPVIDPIQDPVVGNEASLPATQATPFIYIDAFDLNAKVADGDTADDSLLWSYSITGSPIYRINNVDPIDPGTENPNAPGSKKLNGTVVDPAEATMGGDGLSKTITIRNIKYAPIGGGGAAPTATGLIDSQTVRLWCSDGALNANTDLMFWTDNGGNDRLGTPTTPPTEKTYNFSSNNGGFNTNVAYVASGGTATISNVGGAICVETPLAGDVMAGWYGTNDAFTLKPNTVYAVRALINGSQASAGTVPFWDMIIDDWNATDALTMFGGDMMVLDAENGANACYNKPSTNGSVMTFIWAPAPLLTAAWNDSTNGIFRTSEPAAHLQGRLQFRVMDVASNAATTGNLDSGRLCMSKLQVEAIPYSSFSWTQVYDSGTLSSTNMQAATVMGYTYAANYTGGTLNMPAGQATDYIQVRPGDNVFTTNGSNNASIPDNFPIAWESNVVYKAEWNLSAPDALGESNPFDAMWIGMDTVTNELIQTSVITGAHSRSGMPKQGAAQPFVAFMYSHNETASGIAEFHRVRPRLDVGNSTDLSWNANTGGLKVTSAKTYKAALPALAPLQ